MVLQDFSGIRSPEEALHVIEEARQFMRTQQPGVLLVTDVTGASFDKRVLDAIRELAAHHKPYVRASAIVGLSPLARIAYGAITRITGRTIRAFDDLEAAKNGLAEQARAA